MQVCWQAVQEAQRRGLSFRAIAKELGTARNTVRKYARAIRPPVYAGRAAQSNGDGAGAFCRERNCLPRARFSRGQGNTGELDAEAVIPEQLTRTKQ